MSKTQTITLYGTSMYCKPWAHQIDRGFEHEVKGGCWTTGLKLDEASVKLFNAVGSKAKTPNGILTLRRYEFADFGKGIETMGPPKVTGVEPDVLIGNGSDLACVLEVYHTEYKSRPVVGMRWLSVEVTNLVPYEKPIMADDSTPPVF